MLYGLFRFIAGVFKGILAFFQQMFLRKEKFEKIIYEKKLAVYDDLAERLYNLVTVYIETFENPHQKSKLYSEVSEVALFVGGKIYIIDGAVYKKLYDLITTCSNACQFPATDTKIGMADPSKVKHIYFEISNLMRKDLGIDEITREIKQALVFPSLFNKPEKR